ncbi:23S rRNA (uracil(1939)-C(5))-methyltransferase RlmD [Halioglobus japonicus]|nr:23S rRNA (uracil(1939)-C(5))-methyltransferase RlmD [Halioglobus japonicus]
MARSPTSRRPSRRTSVKKGPARLWGKATLTIERMSQEGRGVARRDGKIVFVSGALEGEQVQAQCTAVKKGFDEAVMLERVADSAPNADRVQPECPIFNECGGCSLQHWSMDAQQQHQQTMLQTLLKGDFPLELDPPILSDSAGFRHRLRLLVTRDTQKGFVLALRQHRSRQAVNVEHCLVANPAVNAMIQALPQRLLRAPDLQGLREIEIDADSNNQLGLCFYFAANPGEKTLAELREAMLTDGVIALRARLATHKKTRDDTHASEDDDNELGLWQELLAEGELQLRAGGVIAEGTTPSPELVLGYQPGDFTQTHWAVNATLVARALQWLQPGEDEDALDLFAGIGNFSLPLACKARSVHTFENDASMTARLAANAERNGIDNVRATTLNLMTNEVHLPRADIAILDPPRAGAKAVCEALIKAKVKRLVYISCHPATLLRDARILRQGGYRLAKAAMVDMFPHTGHSEAIALFQRA